MRWREGRRSTNVEDRRGVRLGGRPMLVGGGGLGLLIIVAAVVLGADPRQLLSLLGDGGGGPLSAEVETPATRPAVPGEAGYDPQPDFVSVVLADTEDTWASLFQERAARYEPPQLVLFTDMVQSACGYASAASGPFYCPADRRVYIDLGFYREMRDRFGAPGDFAQAYVIAHEVGHHVQNVLGISDEVQEIRQRVSDVDSNALSVRLELQADCLAGVWAHHADVERQLLEAGDVEEGLAAAAAIGDDRLQRMGGRAVNPESWAHGSSAQRVSWFRRGLESGDIEACDTVALADR